MRALGLHIAIWFLMLIRLPWTIARFIKAYNYAKWVDRRVTHQGEITLSLESGERVTYIRGNGVTLLKFLGAFRDRR